ncbi:hypothetical protein ACHAXA_008233 [Cyclostephanos tholiformis]|uniref:Uncharacterized protein n=1 Tax=Cyclostephanos tholiformis TaxID=382380 RepID=A0ABD3R1L4_9STRA
MMSQMSQMHHRGMSQMQRGMSSTTGGGGNGGLITSSFGSSSSSFHGGGGGGRSVSTSTRTTVINGVRKTVTERTVVHPDGRVERHVETTGDDGHDRDYNVGRSLPPSSSYGDRHLPLDYNGGGGGSSRRRHK